MPTETVVRAGGRLSPLMATLRARRAERLLRGTRNKRLLDIGCGHYPYFLTRSAFSQRYGIDREPGPAWGTVSGVALAVADVERTPTLPFRDGVFDAVTMLAVAEHLDADVLPALLAEARRVLADGGRLVITTPPPWSDPVLRTLARFGLASSTELEEHQSAYTPARLRVLLQQCGFGRARAGLFELGLNVWAAGDRAAGDERTGSLRRTVLRLLPMLLVLGGAIGLAARERSTFSRAVDLVTSSPSPLWLLAFLALVAGRGALGATSFVVAAKRIARAATGAALYAWTRSAVAKYLPGVIWHPLSSVDRLRRFGVGGRSAALSFYVDAVGSIVAAVIVGAIALPALIAEQAGAALWLLLAVPAAISLHPKVFAFGVRVFGRLSGRPMDDVALGWQTVFTVIGLHVGSWLLAGVALQLVLHALSNPVSWPLIFAATSLSWAAGILFVPVPAGLGVREAALVALLVTEIPASAALAAALASRALFVALDVLSFVGSFPAGAAATRSSGRTRTDLRSAPG